MPSQPRRPSSRGEPLVPAREPDVRHAASTAPAARSAARNARTSARSAATRGGSSVGGGTSSGSRCSVAVTGPSSTIGGHVAPAPPRGADHSKATAALPGPGWQHRGHDELRRDQQLHRRGPGRRRGPHRPVHRRDMATGRSPGATLTVDDPATGKVLCEVADAAPEDGMDALAAAAAAQAVVRRDGAARRGEILRRAYAADHGADRRPRTAHDPGDGQAAGREPRARSPTPRSSSAGSPRRRCASTAATRWPRTARAASSCRSSRSGCACSSRRGTSRWPWAPARSVRRSRPAARW